MHFHHTSKKEKITLEQNITEKLHDDDIYLVVVAFVGHSSSKVIYFRCYTSGTFRMALLATKALIPTIEIKVLFLLFPY